MDESRLPLIGEKAPEFQAQTTKGAINSPTILKANGLFFSRIQPIIHRFVLQNLSHLIKPTANSKKEIVKFWGYL